MKNLLLLSVIGLFAIMSTSAQTTVIADNDVRVVNTPGSEVVTLFYTVKEEATVTIEIYNALGQLVTTPLNSSKTEGKHTLNLTSSMLEKAGKVYFLRLTIGKSTYTRKMVNL